MIYTILKQIIRIAPWLYFKEIRVRNAALVLLFIAFSIAGNSQNFIDLGNLNYNISPIKTNGVANTSKYGVNLQLPVVLKNNDAIITGFGISFTEIKKADMDYYQRVQNITLPLGFKRNINEQLSVLILALNQINSGSENVSSKYYQPGLLTMFTLKKSETLEYKIGAFYKQEFSGPFAIPMLGVNWQVNDKIQIYGVLPLSANIMVKPGNKIGY